VTRRARVFVLLLLLAFVLTPIALQPLSARSGKKMPAVAAEQAVFDERAAAVVLGHIRDGLEAHSQRVLLSTFDAGKMDGYLSFSDQVDAYFTRYESFRVTYHILQISQDNGRGVMLADFQVENTPRGGGRTSLRTRERCQGLEDRGHGSARILLLTSQSRRELHRIACDDTAGLGVAMCGSLRALLKSAMKL